MTRVLQFADGGLWLGHPKPTWRRIATRIDPLGITLVGERRSVLHQWRHHDGALADPRAWYVASAGGQRPNGTTLVTREWTQHLGPPVPDVVLALIEYLAVCPEARPALADGYALVHLLRDIDAWEPLRDPPLPAIPFTERHDIRRALQPIIDREVIVIDGRPVGGQPLPDFQALTWAAKPALDESVFHDHILEEAKRMLSATPWPFEALLRVRPTSQG